jgi:hypothetical protein
VDERLSRSEDNEGENIMHPWHHALSSVKKFGGIPEDYIKIHNWFDATKSGMANFRHRAMRHHSEGIFECEERFGITIKNSSGKTIPTRVIGEQHVTEDLGFIPTMRQWLVGIPGEKWMFKNSALTADQQEQLAENKPIAIGMSTTQ